MLATIPDETLHQGIAVQDIQVCRHTAPAHWESARQRLAGSFYLSDAFARIMVKQGYTPLFFTWQEQQQPKGLALGFLTDQWRRWPGNVIARGFYWQTHPAVVNNDQAAQTEFVHAVLKIVYRIGVTSIHLHSEDAVVSPAHLDTNGHQRHERLEYRIPLMGNAADVMAAIAARKRTYLRSALKASQIEVKEVFDIDSVRKLIDFQHVSRDRRRSRGEDYDVATHNAANAIFSSYVQPGHARLFISYQDTQPLSGILLHVDGRVAYYTMSGCSANGFQANAPLITVWKSIERLCSDGYKVLNMGGVAASSADAQDLGHGLYRFKRSFGGEEVRCTSWRKEMPGWRAFLAKRLF